MSDEYDLMEALRLANEELHKIGNEWLATEARARVLAGDLAVARERVDRLSSQSERLIEAMRRDNLGAQWRSAMEVHHAKTENAGLGRCDC